MKTGIFGPRETPATERGRALNGPYVDLHVHSCHSDGSMTPAEIVEAARDAGVGILAVADHNMLEGSRQIRPLCARAGIRHIPAAELDALEGETSVHVLAYGFDMADIDFRFFVKKLRGLLDGQSVTLIQRMSRDFAQITLPDFMAYTYDTRQGGWKGLHYLVEKGAAATLREAMAFYDRYGVTFAEAGFPSVETVCREIHSAGGRAVLAHPGVTLRTDPIAEFSANLKKLLGKGLDGVECYYPRHSPEVTAACLAACRERGLLITAGSDCHGSFGSARVGEMDVTLDRLVLGGLLPGA